MKIKKHKHGRYGLKSVFAIPKIANGNGSITQFKLKINKKFTYKGKKVSVLTAKCPDGRLQAHAVSEFDGGPKLTTEFVRPCIGGEVTEGFGTADGVEGGCRRTDSLRPVASDQAKGRPRVSLQLPGHPSSCGHGGGPGEAKPSRTSQAPKMTWSARCSAPLTESSASPR